MRTLPFCTECCVEMRCAKNEVVVVSEHAAYYGDRFECPDCRASVVTNWGDTPAAPSKFLDLDEFIEKATEAGFEIYEEVSDNA
ncbi:MAG: hypothetical protein K0U84_13430 [Actinomycetia bacterium]|nr:hypothetical protein [Actinomycetes bacterium]